MIVNEWPESQACIGCKHAVFLLEGSSRYMCERELTAWTEECSDSREEVSEEEWLKKFS